MANNFIPAFHRINPAEKLKSKFCMEVVNYCWYNTRNYNLLWNKNIKDIEEYASGEFDLTPFKRMFKSEAKRMQQNKDPNFINNNNVSTAIGIDYTCLPLIPEKLNSAKAIIQKIPLEITCKAFDPLAIEKKEKDINFLKNKPIVEADLQIVADKMQLGKVDLGTTTNSAVEYSDSPYGMDLHNPEELDVFIKLMYSLKIEAAMETALQELNELKNVSQIKLLEITDHLKYGISTHAAFQNSLTGLPDVDYIYPGDMEVPYSELPDYSDNSHRVWTKRVTPNQLWDYFGDEIGKEEDLMIIMNDGKYGYCACNQQNPINKGNLDTFKITLKKIEVKSIDWVGISKKKKSKKGFTALTTDPDKATEKIWAQNTYSFWWLFGTNHIFGIERLPFSQRTKGKESFQNFSTNIYRSQERSAVELSIGENKKAQIADIKLQHAVIKSLPAGRYIDLNFLRGALSGLKDEANAYTMESLLGLAMEQNIILGDTSGFDGKNDGQFKPVIDLPGGLKSEIVGYMQIIASANANISRVTGINAQLTGQGANPEGLVGLQKLLINSSINSLYYCNEAITKQYQRLFSIWANGIQQAVEEGGKTKAAIVSMIGMKKANIIDGLNDIQLHQIGIFIKLNQREEERDRFQRKLDSLIAAGVISTADEFLLDNIDNPRDKFALLAVKEIRFKKEQEKVRQMNFQNQQQLIQMQGQNQVQAQTAKTDGEIKTVYAKGDVQAKITELASSLGINALQLQAIIKKNLQDDRSNAQLNKSIATLNQKSELQQQESLI